MDEWIRWGVGVIIAILTPIITSLINMAKRLALLERIVSDNHQVVDAQLASIRGELSKVKDRDDDLRELMKNVALTMEQLKRSMEAIHAHMNKS
jgi:hypothetical protein